MSATYDAALYATERRTIIFVDAGFLLRVMQEHHQAASRAQLAIDHPTLIDFLRRSAEETLGCPVLRIYWYDAVDPSGKVPNLVAAAMSRVDGVRVRRGILQSRPDGRTVQKAVDTLLVRDMIVHAYKRSAGEMVLVSGDRDLTPGVEEAQEQGTRVHLWSIRGDELSPSVGRSLTELVDSHLELGAERLAESIRLQPGRDQAAVEPVDGAPPRMPIPKPGPPPSAADASRPNGMPAPAESLAAQTAGVYSTDEQAWFATLYDLNREAYNSPVSPPTASTIGQAYAHRWRDATDGEQLRRLQEQHDPSWSGNIPAAIDSDLLFFGQEHGLDTYARHLKLALRKAFWTAVVAVDGDVAGTEEHVGGRV